MVNMLAHSASRDNLTPGEVEGKMFNQYYLAPSKGGLDFGLQGLDFIPATKGGLRSTYSAFSAEASHLPEADLRRNSKFEKVWGNAAFESDDSASSPAATPSKPGTIKLNNLFDEPSTRDRQVDQQSTPQKGGRTSSSFAQEGAPASTSAEARGPSMINFFRKGPSERNEESAGTMVQAFEAEDEDHVQVAARPRAAAATPVAREKTVGTWEVELKQLISSSMRHEAIHLAAPSGGVGLVRCYIKRVKGFFGGHCSFHLYLDNGDVFLLAARRRKKSKVSSYVISQDLDDLKRDTDNCIAKLKSNFIGTEYMLWGKTDDVQCKKGYGSEQLCISYTASKLKSMGGPRSMHVILPLPDSNWQPSAPDGSDSLSHSLDAAKNRALPPLLERKVAILSTKQPEFDPSMKAFTLDFHGRVKEASVKNFQLVSWDHNTDRRGGDVLLQFGKIENDLFALDFAHPLSIFSAFSIALASIDTKLCYTM